MHYYLKLEDFEVLPMFGECEIDVTNSKVKIKLDKNENLWWKKFEVQKQKKIRDLDNKWYYLILWNQNFNMLQNIQDFCVFRSHHIQIERLIKVIHFYSLSVLYPYKEQKGQKLPNYTTNIYGIYKNCLYCMYCDFAFFRRANWGYICKHKL